MSILQGKTALVTGSDTGIGRAIAIEFARNGAQVIVTYNSNEKNANEVLDSIRAAGSSGAVFQLDVSDEERVAAVFAAAIKQFGQLDILVNNAGVNGSNIPLGQMPTEVFDKTIKTNLYGTFFCCREYVQYMKRENHTGKIINISSVHEEIATPGNADYNASKGGIKNLSRSLALELAAENIPVNNIAPGMILTHMNQAAMDDATVRKEKEDHIPMKRAGKPEEIAKLALYLAGPDSSYITGSTFVMDGGLTINSGQGA
jgi:glucose 1-dehydrogenase